MRTIASRLAITLVLLTSLAAIARAEAPPIFVTKWGTLGSGDGQFNNPRHMALDAAGNVYVAEISNHRVQKFSSTGAFLTKWGTNGTGDGQFQGAFAIAVASNGEVYVGESIGDRIQRFTSAGAFLGKWGSSGTGDGQFDLVGGIAVDASGNVYVCDYNNHRIQKFTSTGVFLTKWGSAGTGPGQFAFPAGIAVDASGVVYVADSNNERVQMFTDTGAFLGTWGSSGSGDGQFTTPIGVAIDAAGRVYVTDFAGSRVQKFTSSGAFVAKWGSFGSGNGQFSGTSGIGVHSDGHIFVVCGSNQRVQKFAALPAIESIQDVGNDQGRQVRIEWLRTTFDAAGSVTPVTQYEVYRRNDPGLAPARIEGLEPAAAQLAGWTYVGAAPAHLESEYSLVVPTLVDSGAGGIRYSTFLVRAATAAPGTFYDSGPDSGYSADDLAPFAPAPFTGEYGGATTALHWGLSEVSDFKEFRLHRGSEPDFIPSAGNLIAAQPDTGYVDPAGAPFYYKLSAVDVNDNESPFATLLPSGTVGVEAGGRAGLWLAQPGPNPVQLNAILRFGLPVAARATLTLHDVAGRTIRTLVNGPSAAGEQTVAWDLKDDAGRRVASGIVFVRLAVGDRFEQTRLVVLP